ARHIRREKLDKEMALAQQRLASARPAPPVKTRVASVEVEAERAGTLTVRLSYFAPGASWRPSYRAGLDPATGRVALVSEAVVRQTTGEDWSGVMLHLSTAAPARGVTPPVLFSWLLSPARRGAASGTYSQTSASDSFMGDLPIQGRNFQNVLTSAPGVQSSTFDGVSNVDPLTGIFMSNINPDAVHDLEIISTPASVAVVRSSYTVAFDVPGRVEVPGDGHEHRVVLRGEDLDGKVEYRTL